MLKPGMLIKTNYNTGPYRINKIIRNCTCAHVLAKWSMAKVSRLLRHQNKQTTEKYLQVEDQGLRQVMESLEGDF